MKISKDEGVEGDLDAGAPEPGFDCDRCVHRHLGEEYGFICVGCECERRAPDVRNAFMDRIRPPKAEA